MVDKIIEYEPIPLTTDLSQSINPVDEKRIQ